jgi:sigma54-dependent transcription regulator
MVKAYRHRRHTDGTIIIVEVEVSKFNDILLPTFEDAKKAAIADYQRDIAKNNAYMAELAEEIENCKTTIAYWETIIEQIKTLQP